MAGLLSSGGAPELRSANSGLADMIAERFGPEAGAMAERMIRIGKKPAEIITQLTGIPMAAHGGRALGEASVTGDTMKGLGGAAEIGLAAVPYSGMAARALATVPRALGYGAAATAAPMMAGGLLSADPAEAETVKQARARAEADKSSARAKADLLKAQGDADAAAIKRAEDKARTEEANSVRIGLLADAPKPFSERFPAWSDMQPFLPAGIGAATAAAMTVPAAIATRGAAGRWRNAVSEGERATTPAALAASAGKAAAFSEQFPKLNTKGLLAPYAAPAVVGTVEGAATTNIPEAYNSFLPSVNPERKAWEEYIKRLPADSSEVNRAQGILKTLPQTMPARDAALDYFSSPALLKRTGVGAMEGLGGALFGTTMGKLAGPSDKALPRAESKALLERLKTDASGMSDATKYLISAEEANAALALAREQAAMRAASRNQAIEAASTVPDPFVYGAPRIRSAR